MKTSYRGCNEEIAESLKRGQHIPCMVWDIPGDRVEETVIAYEDGAYVDSNGAFWDNATAVKTTIKMVKPHLAIMQQLIDDGYALDSEGDWMKGLKGFSHLMWIHCGTSNLDGFNWDESWLEEVEL